MALNLLHQKLEEKEIKFLFTDYYDTIVHRHVHPNYAQRIWAKHIIRELGLRASVDELYFTRQESIRYLAKNLKKINDEIPYHKLKEEVCRRLINTDIISVESKDDFITIFEDADVRAECSVQYLNQDVVDTLELFKSNGGKIYLISDFYGSKSLFEKLLTHHGILDLFDGVYSSAELEKSKHKGNIYEPIISELSIDPKEAMMIGDNPISDCANAIKSGLNAYLLPHKKYLKKNKRNNFGNDKRRLQSIVNTLYRNSKKGTSTPYTEYIVFYHTFVERLYETARKNNIKDLFFLSREGQYLKRLFDSYQEFAYIGKSKKINTHYLKISRHAALQISLKNLGDEPFTFLQKKFRNLSIDDFLLAINCPNELRSQIILELKIDGKAKVTSFFNSEIFKTLKENKRFKDYYDDHRKISHKAFKAYINSFHIDFRKEGINLVDIGWGGTMQEAIYEFFDCEIPISGFYFGLNEIYNIQPKTKRYGLNFSLMPYADYHDNILMANLQLYEQFSAADHGSAIDYSLEVKNFVLEHHKPEEKWLYDTHIKAHQEEMFRLHKSLLKALEPLCYNREIMQETISKLALKLGLFQNTKKLKFINMLNEGFYQNVGTNKVGISYEPPEIKNLFKSNMSFLMTPEKYFRYLVKLKPMLYKKNRLIAFFAPTYLIYLYFNFNKYLRYKILNRFFLLKYNAFK